jgi:hypothetical protein
MGLFSSHSWCACPRQEHEGEDGTGPCQHCEACDLFVDESPTERPEPRRGHRRLAPRMGRMGDRPGP